MLVEWRCPSCGWPNSEHSVECRHPEAIRRRVIEHDDAGRSSREVDELLDALVAAEGDAHGRGERCVVVHHGPLPAEQLDDLLELVAAAARPLTADGYPVVHAFTTPSPGRYEAPFVCTGSTTRFYVEPPDAAAHLDIVCRAVEACSANRWKVETGR